jgi:hypothetical protein
LTVLFLDCRKFMLGSTENGTAFVFCEGFDVIYSAAFILAETFARIENTL